MHTNGRDYLHDTETLAAYRGRGWRIGCWTPCLTDRKAKGNLMKDTCVRYVTIR